MVFWLTILEILKLGLLLDLPIHLLLAGLLPATDGFYFSKWVGRGPKLLLWGTLLHVLCTWGGAAPKYSGCTIPGLPALSAALTVLLGAGPVVTPLPIPLARLLLPAPRSLFLGRAAVPVPENGRALLHRLVMLAVTWAVSQKCCTKSGDLIYMGSSLFSFIFHCRIFQKMISGWDIP